MTSIQYNKCKYWHLALSRNNSTDILLIHWFNKDRLLLLALVFNSSLNWMFSNKQIECTCYLYIVYGKDTFEHSLFFKDITWWHLCDFSVLWPYHELIVKQFWKQTCIVFIRSNQLKFSRKIWQLKNSQRAYKLSLVYEHKRWCHTKLSDTLQGNSQQTLSVAVKLFMMFQFRTSYESYNHMLQNLYMINCFQIIHIVNKNA